MNYDNFNCAVQISLKSPWLRSGSSFGRAQDWEKRKWQGSILCSALELIHSSLTADYCLDNDYVTKQPTAWKERCLVLTKQISGKHG